MASTVLLPRVGRAPTELGPEVPTSVGGTEVGVDPLSLNNPQAVVGLAPIHQAPAVVRHMLVGRDVPANNEDAAGALHSRASKRDRLTRSPRLLAAVLVVVTAPSVMLAAR